MDRSADVLLAALKTVLEHRETLSREAARSVMDAMLSLGAEPGGELRAAALLGGLAARGETVEELAGFVDSLRAHATPIPLTAEERLKLVDTCGTGGDASGTFNISTAAALVAAAAGAWVAKHGNRAVTSACGSADVLEALGIPVDLTPQTAADSLRRHGFAFLPAPALQPAMRAVMPVRRALGVRTAFNLLGPMSNPAGATAQVLGVYAEDKVTIVAETLARLGTRHALVVHGGDTGARAGLDEFSLAGSTNVAAVRDSRVKHDTVSPEMFGFNRAPLSALAGGNAATNAAILQGIFAGKRGPQRDIVVLNAAAVLVVAGFADSFSEGVQKAQETIDSGSVTLLIERLRG